MTKVKILSVLMVLMMAFSVVACTENEGAVSSNGLTSAPAVENTDTESNKLQILKSDFKLSEEDMVSRIKAEYLIENGGYKDSDEVVVMLNLNEEPLIDRYLNEYSYAYSSVSEFASSEVGKKIAKNIEAKQTVLVNELKAKGHKPLGIRLDSGDLAYLTKKARKMLDEAGFPDTIICASGDLDEKLVQSLKLQGAKINSWGIGTKLITSADMPALGGVYKLAGVEREDGTIIPKIKVSDNSAKITNPGYKKIVRIYDKASGKAEADLIMLKDEVIDVTKPLTITHPLETWKKTTFTNYEIRELSVKIVEKGKLIYKMPTLKEIAKYSKTEMESFWDEYLRIDAPHIFKVDLSDKLLTLKTDMLEKIRKGNSANGK